MERVLVVGTSGSGKTTFAERLAGEIGADHVELDGLFWNAGWEEADLDTFRERATAALAAPKWVACGNYWSKLNDITWARADTVIWLDLPVVTCWRRIIVRTVRRSLRRQELWSGNRERISGLWGKDSLLREIRTRKRQFDDRYGNATKDPRFAHVDLVRLRTRAEVRGWWRTPGATG